jgi:hypothetical protein
MGTILFATEDVADVREDIEYLLQEHYEELCANKEIVKLAPDWDRYLALEAANKLLVYTVRDGGVLVGYSVWFVDVHIHYVGQLFANNDIIFLSKTHRNTATWWTVTQSVVKRWLGITPKDSVGKQLIAYSEEQLKLIGVTKAIWHIKFKLDWSPILFRRGYAREDFTVAKIL